MPLFALLDKSEFEEVIASVSEPIFEPRQGRKRIARGGTAKPWNPGYRKKKKIEPGATER